MHQQSLRALFTHVYLHTHIAVHICDAIKQNESEVENFSFLFFGIFYEVII